MPQIVFESAQRLNITATDTSLVSSQARQLCLLGVFVSQTSSGTLKLADSLGGIILNTFSPTAGTFYPVPCEIQGQLTATVGGTLDATIFYGTV